MKALNSSYPAFLAPTKLEPLLAPEPPKFPSFNEQVLAMGEPAEKPRARGTFESLLGSPEILYDAWLDEPERYGPAVGQILLKLLTGTKLPALTAEELAALDAATLEFAQQPRKRKPAVPVPEPRQLTKSTEPDDADQGDGDERDLEWNGGRGQRFNPPGTSAKILNEEALGSVPTHWWRR